MRCLFGKAALARCNRFDRIAGNMRTDNRQGGFELDKSANDEATAVNRSTRLSIRIATVTHSPPERFHKGLDSAKHCSRWRGDMLNKDEFAAGFEHPLHFGKGPALVDNATKNQGTDRVINRFRFDRQLLRGPAQNVYLQPHTGGLFCQVPIHVGVRLYTDPADPFPCKMSEVRSGARADFQDLAGDVREQFGLVRGEVTVRLVAEPRHKPSENAQSQGSGAATEARGITLGEFSTQYIDYNATKACPP